MKYAVTYLRCSTATQERSISDQRDVLKRHARKHGFYILKEFVDDGVSGAAAIEERKDFINMVDFVESNKGKIDALLVYDISRFSRGDPDEMGYYHYRLRMAGCQVIFIAEDLPEGHPSDLMRDILQWQKREYVKQLARDSFRGVVFAVKRGHKVGGPTPFGYVRCLIMPDGSKHILKAGTRILRKKKGYITLIPGDPKEVDLVQRIFHMYVHEGLGSYRITGTLTAEDIPPPSPAKSTRVGGWCPSTITYMLKNPVYVGVACYNRKSKGSFYTLRGGIIEQVDGRRGCIKHAETEWIKIENAYEPIISRELFDRAQEIMRRRSPGYRKRSKRHGSDICGKKGKRIYMLSSLLYCGHCGEKMYCQTLKQARRDRTLYYSYYSCSRYLRQGKAMCRGRSIRCQLLDRLVLTLLKQHLLRWLDEIQANGDMTEFNSDGKTASLVAMRAFLKFAYEINRRLSMWAKSTFSPACDHLSQAVDSQITDYTKRTRPNDQAIHIVESHWEAGTWILGYVQRLIEVLNSEQSDIVREIVRVFVRRVTLYFQAGREASKNLCRLEKGMLELNTHLAMVRKSPQLFSKHNLVTGTRIIYFTATDLDYHK